MTTVKTPYKLSEAEAGYLIEFIHENNADEYKGD